MKKNFFKKMSVVLALALTVSAVAPAATTASAAAAPAFKSASVNVKVGQTKSYGMNNVTPWSVKKFVTGNKKVATVAKSGKTAKVTGVGEGKTTLRADLVAYKSKRTLQVRMPVTVVPDKAEIKSVVQNTTTKFTVAFSAALEEVKVADFAFERDNDNVVIPVKDVELSTDKKAVTLETYNSLTDGNVYTVTYDAKSAKVTVTDGTPASVGITPEFVTVGSTTTIYAVTKDVNGVELTKRPKSNLSNGVAFDVDSILGGGYMSEDKLYLNAVDDKATFKVEYHSYTYNDDGTEKTFLSGTFTVTAVADTSYIDGFDYSIGGTEFKAGEKSIAVGDAEAKLWFQIKNNSGDTLTEKGYSLESSDTSKFIISGNSDEAEIIPVGAGSAYIIVKDGNNVIKTLPVTVSPARVASIISISKNSITVGAGMNEETLGEKIKATAKDQYGKSMAVSITAIEKKSGTEVLTDLKTIPGLETEEVNIYNAGAVGTGIYEVKIKTPLNDKEYVRNLTVNVKEMTGNVEGYRLIASDVNTTVTGATVAGEAFSVYAAEVKNGVVAGYADGNIVSAAAVVRDNLGKTVGDCYESVDKDAAVVGGIITTVTASELNGNTIIKNLSAGTYTVSATLAGKHVTTKFEVKDEQKQVTCTVNKTNAGGSGTLNALFENKVITVKYDGEDYNSKLGFVTRKTTNDYRVTGKFAFVGTVKVPVIIGTVELIFEIPINQTFTNDSGSWS